MFHLGTLFQHFTTFECFAVSNLQLFKLTNLPTYELLKHLNDAVKGRELGTALLCGEKDDFKPLHEILSDEEKYVFEKAVKDKVFLQHFSTKVFKNTTFNETVPEPQKTYGNQPKQPTQ